METEYQRRFIITRHGERLDAWIHRQKFNCHPYETPAGMTKPANWMDYAFKGGVYHPFDDNAPPELAVKKENVEDWRHDTPLTLSGRKDARLLGRQRYKMAESGAQPDLIFVSPALRSMETAVAIREGLGSQLQLKVEPALYEFFTRDELPALVSAEEYSEAGFPVQTDFLPCRSADSLYAPEPYLQYYQRLRDFVLWTTEKFPEAKTILLVAHSTTMDTGTRMIRGLPALSKSDFWRQLMPNLSMEGYLSSVSIHQRQDGEWVMTVPPPPPTPALQSLFDWRFMIPDLSTPDLC